MSKMKQVICEIEELVESGLERDEIIFFMITEYNIDEETANDWLDSTNSIEK